jgi:hypothetical protein
MLSHTRKLQLADPKNESEDLPIEILIGGDNYWKIVKDSSPIRLTSSVVLLPSKLGWILSVSRSGITVNSVMVNYVKLNTSSPNEDILRRFWDLENIGSMENQDSTPSLKDSALLQEFAASFCLEDQRRLVSFPRKENITVPNNRHEAEKRFLSLEKKLEKNGHLKQIYQTQMLDHIRKEHVEVAPPEKDSREMFYLSHHAVKKERLGTTKWRIVFDGSSHENNAPSLNDSLEMGPKLLLDVFAILLRFRLYPVALIGDISQAFLQLVLHRKHRDLTRFMWYRVILDQEGNYITTSDRITFRFTILPFGLTCSPFLLSATL